jgi:type I restriction enzyme S subunit
MKHPRAFAVWFEELDRWDTTFFRGVRWNWPEDVFVSIGSLLERKNIEVDPRLPDQEKPIIEKISFGGELVITQSEARRDYKGRLFWAQAGDFIYSKIRVKQGSCTIVPAMVPSVAVSAEYPVYQIRADKVLPEYFSLLIRCNPFLQMLEGLSHGSSTKTRIHPAQFETIQVPLPPLSVQQAIVDRWQQAQAEIAAAQGQATQQESKIAQYIYTALGVPKPLDNGPPPKCLALQWEELERWSFNYLIRSRQGLLGFHKSAYPIVPLNECLEDTMNGYCIKPVAGPTPHKMLKLNALAPAGLDLTKTKYINVPDNIAQRFSLRKGDLLICRSVGSYDHVAKCALVEDDCPNILFPDIIIRARLKPSILPQFAREVMQTPIGRSHFLSNARTAVGMWKIGAEDIRSLPLPVPPLDIQQKIVQQVAEMRGEIARIREAAERLAQENKADIESLILGVKKLETGDGSFC